MSDLDAIARQVRGLMLEISHRAQTPHVGGCLSCVDLLVASYWGALRIDPARPDDPDRDRFVFSKGHAAAAFYAALHLRGFISRALMETYSEPGAQLPEHPTPGCAPGVEATSGSLGHGLSMGAGMALAARIQKRPSRVFVCMSDGECNEGSVWEAALFAPANKLGNLVAMIDYNGWQATGRTDEVLGLAPLVDKWRAFGWSAHEVDGHDIAAIVKILREVPDASGKPIAIVARTLKGKGVSIMENDNNWHYRIPTADELKQALATLGVARHFEPRAGGGAA